MSYEVRLKNFDGPLDLLIHLIEKSKIDIYEVNITEIANQFIEQIELWKKLDLDVSSDFIVMAARLLEIKSFALLPQILDDGQEEDSKEVLIKQLINYRVFKKIGIYLSECSEKNRGILFKDPEYIQMESEASLNIEIDKDTLLKTYKYLLSANKESSSTPPPKHMITGQLYSVEDKIEELLLVLNEIDGRKVLFSQFSDTFGEKQEIIAAFYALLELYKKDMISLYQKEIFCDILVKLKEVKNGTSDIS